MSSEGSNSRKNFEMDRISNLPDEILAHILSFLPTEEAVQTCVLSKRWRKVWAIMPALDFKLLPSSVGGYGHYGLESAITVARFERFVNGVLDNREQINLDTVRYACYVDDGKPPSTGWLDRVTLSMPRLIYIYISIYNSIDVPDMVFSCASLRHLTMVLSSSRAKRTIIAPASINLPSLEYLKLQSVVLHDDFAQKLFKGCRSLATLVLDYCNLHLSEISSDVLKELTITMCRQYKHMQVSCPAVVTLSIDIFDRLTGIQLKNMPSLVNAEFQLRKRGHYSDGFMPALNLFDGLSNSTSLKIYLGYPESKKLKKQLEKNVPHCRDFTNLKKLSIGNWDMSSDFYLIAYLLEHSPNLIELTLYPDDSCWKRGHVPKPVEVLKGSVSYRHEYLETVRIYDGGARKLSQRLMKTLVKTLHSYVKKIENIVTFAN